MCVDWLKKLNYKKFEKFFNKNTSTTRGKKFDSTSTSTKYEVIFFEGTGTRYEYKGVGNEGTRYGYEQKMKSTALLIMHSFQIPLISKILIYRISLLVSLAKNNCHPSTT